MIALAATFTLLGGLLHPPASSIQTQQTTVSGWRLTVRKDTFSGQATCRLRRGQVESAHGLVTFRFRHWTNTTHALFRIDDGAPQSAQAVAPEAAGMGAALVSSNLSNPSDGKVFIPLARLQNGHKVTIRPTPSAAPRTFSLEGLFAATEAAKAQGCTDK